MRWYWLVSTSLFVLWLSGSLGISTAHAADDANATLTASQPTLTVGDVVTLTLAVTHSIDAGIVPVAPERTWGAFEIRRLAPVTTQSNPDGSATSRQQLGVTLWLTGTYGTPPLAVTVVDGAGQQQRLFVTPISLTVTSVLTATDRALRDLKPQAALPLPALWPWLLAKSIGVLLLIGAAWWRYKRLRPRISPAPVVKPDLRPAYQVALDELERLQQLQLPAQQRFKEHYTLVTDALRRYLTGAFAIPAIDQTTVEIRQALKQTALPATQKSNLLQILQEADLVKFAGLTPTLEEAEQLLAGARTFVLTTKAAPMDTPPVTADYQQPQVTP